LPFILKKNSTLKRNGDVKRNFESLVEKHDCIVFDICSMENDPEYLEEYFLKFDKSSKDETKKNIFLFHHLSLLYEKFVDKGQHKLFEKLYEGFYSQFGSLKYKVDESYNITGMEFFQVRLKVRVKDKTLKKLWYGNKLVAPRRGKYNNRPKV